MFITDDKNIMTILAGIGAQDLLKKAQVTPDANDEAYRLAKPFIANLQKQLDPSSVAATSPVSVVKGADPTPTADVSNFRTLGDFIQWAAEKQLTWNGKRFAWLPNESQEAQSNGAWSFTSYKKDRSDRNANTREAEPVTAYALKPELVSYLSYLRDHDAQNNKVLQVMLKSIIEELNTWLKSAGEETITSKSKPEAAVKSELDPAAVVDGLPSDVLDMNDWDVGLQSYPSFTNASKKLTVKDISDQGSFLAWLRYMKVKSGDATVYALDTKGDPCQAIQVLYKRAAYLNSVALGADKVKPNYSKMTALYLKAVQEYGSQLKGKDGKACSVSSAEISTPNKSTDKTTTPQAGAPTVNQLNKIVMSLPLRVQSLDFNKIRTFFNAYRPIADATMQGLMNDAETAMVDVKNHLVHPLDEFNMMASISDVKTWLKPPQGQHYSDFSENLQKVLSNTGTVIRNFKNRFADTDSGEAVINTNNQMGQDMISRINAQVGQVGSIYESNWDQLRSWDNQILNVVKR